MAAMRTMAVRKSAAMMSVAWSITATAAAGRRALNRQRAMPNPMTIRPSVIATFITEPVRYSAVSSAPHPTTLPIDRFRIVNAY